MRVGTLAYATEQGLGYLAKSFVDAGVVTDVLVVVHGKRPTFPWYPGSPHLHDVRDAAAIVKFCSGLDAMLYFETCFNYVAMRALMSRGVRTVLMPMHECTPKDHPVPDAYVAPSLLEADLYDCPLVPVPVEEPWKERGVVKTFVHNAGHGGLKGRNGTDVVLEAVRHLRKPTRLIVRSQDELPWFRNYRVGDVHVTCEVGSVARTDLYSVGEAFVFPEKFNGLSLPLQEAYASGMLVIAADRRPINAWLPREPLVPCTTYRDSVGPRFHEYDRADMDPRELAAAMDRWNGADVSEFSARGRAWAQENSWEKLKPKYLEVLHG